MVACRVWVVVLWDCGTLWACATSTVGGGSEAFQAFVNPDEYPPGVAPTNLWATLGPSGNLQGNLQGTGSLFFWGGGGRKGNAKNIQIEWSTE